MKDTQFDIENTTETRTHSQTYKDAVAAFEAAEQKREQQGYATMLMASGLAGGFHEKGKPGRVVVIARSFCILFAFAVPNLLLIRYVF
ncbi:hypothetical protein [Aestuariivita boseongensis]|uniref:hypothetical protein n=1 Tax=Aestuariivita boseongensis TaxID=1470562 RepID=UPI00067FDB09|nr:hypothetical protein [Aestuariivita boseongensis]